MKILGRVDCRLNEPAHRSWTDYRGDRSISVMLLMFIFLNSTGCSDVVVSPPNMTGGETGVQTQAGSFQFGGNALGGMFGDNPGATPDIPDSCESGENLGICMVCGLNLTPIKPLNDDRCPYLPCETLTRYQAMPAEDQGRVCVQYLATAPMDNCKEIGICYEDADEACMLNPTPMELFTVYPGCGEFTGCDGDISPDASIKSEGEACHSIGTCDAEGRCSAPASCEGDKPDYVKNHCPDPNMDEGCDLFVDMNGVPNADDISCTLACATQNGCLKGWDSNNGCERGGEIGCNTRRRQLICRCQGN